MATDSPPSYDSLVKQANTFPSNPTTKDVDNIIAQAELLASTTAKVSEIGIASENQPPTEEETHSLSVQVSQAMNSKFGYYVTKTAAQCAGEAVRAINDGLEELTREIAKVDLKYSEANFSGEFVPFVARYKKIVRESQSVAKRIAAYSKSFQKIVKPVLNDPTVAGQAKEKFLQNFISDAKQFKTDANNTESDLAQLATDFSQFSVKFKAFGEVKEKDLNAKVTVMQEELKKLSEEVAELRRKAQRSVDVSIGVGLCLGMVGVFFPPALPALLVLGALSVGSGAAAAIAFTKAANDTNELYNKKDAEMQQTKKELGELQAVRASLAQITDKNVALFTVGIGYLNQVWRQTTNDADEILTYLQTARSGQEAEIPSSVKLALDEANVACRSIPFLA